MTPLAETIQNRLKSLSRPDSELKAKFFKTGPGEYSEGDQFLNVSVPAQRALSKEFAAQARLEDLSDLLASPWHECRLTALFILVLQAKKAKGNDLERFVRFYEERFDRVNNWDLVDSSAPHLLGPWYFERDRSVLFDWAKSEHLWTVRIAVLTTQYFIRQKDFSTTLELAAQLLKHQHDLIHKAVGWMLREVGDENFETENEFVKKHHRSMPRTMLRYATEKFPKDLYKSYLAGMP